MLPLVIERPLKSTLIHDENTENQLNLIRCAL